MASFNRVVLLGNVTRDPELRYIASGTAVTDIGLAVNDRRKTPTGEWVEETTFVDVTLWGRTAEVACEYVTKGSPLLIEGRLKLDTWEMDGKKNSKLRVVGEKMQLLGSRGEGPRSDGPRNEGARGDGARSGGKPVAAARPAAGGGQEFDQTPEYDGRADSALPHTSGSKVREITMRTESNTLVAAAGKRLPKGKRGGIELLLVHAVEHLGKQGDVVEVKRGFALNYLIPQGLATVATDHHKRMVDKHRTKLEEIARQRLAGLRSMLEELVRTSVTIEANANDEGHLYGSVGSTEISRSLKQQDLTVAADQIILQGPLKEVGLYTVKVRLAPEVEGDLKVWVVPSSGETAAK